MLLPGRLPAYISWEQYQRNRAQLQSNKAAATGVVRAGQALLSGLLVCGLRMMAQYNNNGATPRSSCVPMAFDYGEPVCQTLKAAPLDALMVRLVLEALDPAALEASLLAAGELGRERTALDAQWRHRLERAGYQAERARRQFDAIEPENRLVGRTLERQWEQALAEKARLAADDERFPRHLPLAWWPPNLASAGSTGRPPRPAQHLSRSDRPCHRTASRWAGLCGDCAQSRPGTLAARQAM